MDIKDDNYDDFTLDDKSTYESSPRDHSYDVFYLRNNPEPLIEDFYLYLTNQVKNTNPETMLNKPYISIGRPLLNKQGVRDLVNFMRTFINGHTVQTNVNETSLLRIMRFTADDLAMFMVNSIDDWEIEERYTRSIHNELVAKCELFLRRGLDDKEREHYSQEQRHEYSHNTSGEKKKRSLGLPNFIKGLGKE